MISITDYINMKGKKFREKLASGYTMCECDTLRFNEGQILYCAGFVCHAL